jgi:hypothetical protein
MALIDEGSETRLIADQNHFYGVGTPLRAVRYRNDWFEITEPSTSGWIYRKYLGAISHSEQGKIASQETQGQRARCQGSS